MIVVDTNIISEPMRSRPDPRVEQWLNDQPPATLFLTSVSQAELLVGVELVPDGQRKRAMFAQMEMLLDSLFGPRILPFTTEAARIYATAVAHARKNGFNTSMADGQIASIARVNGFSVATRDQAAFEALGVPVINPWTA
ncbi:type II toxin-antitoxin system VapC family toxin [Rhizobium alvei]|uniref:Ribonuclease VapC n=1 Tax=Rhizobium alvei TaxID=1132659 RepID=A0ABT8YKZ9_9HYPH|nr:type II toxin-antitoxin system VapC family toxin [Rhizobium alvei]MDO6964408.1 type II toxin-antitoxin system VapC family toxin [Rhizobium alvei]